MSHDSDNKFKSSQGVYLTKQLFYEVCSDKETALYTLKDYDLTIDGPEGQKTYPSILRLFVTEGDETGFVFAKKYFDSWKHYKKLLQAPWFSNVISEAKEELSVQQAANALLAVSKRASEGDLRANQYLLEKKWVDKDSVGRPSKASIKEEANRLFQQSDLVTEDAARILEFKRQS